MIRSPIRGGGSGSGFALVPGATGVRLVAPGSVSAALTFTRAQVAMFSTALAPDGVTVQNYAANIPRFNGAARRLLWEAQSTNVVPNPRGEGAVVGTPGTLPTGWALTLIGGISSQVLALLSENGLTGVRVRIFGTASANGNPTFSFGGSGAASPGQVWTPSYYLRLSAGSLTGLQVIRGRVGFTGGGNVDTALSPVPDGTLRRYSIPGTAPAGTTAAAGPGLFWFTASGDTIDATFDIFFPQMDLGAFATTPMLPPAGSPAATLRGDDAGGALVSTLFPNFAGTIIFKAMFPRSAPASADQMLGQLHDGTDSNRIRLRNVAGGNTIVLGHVIGGSATDAASLGSMTPGTAFKGMCTFGGNRVAGLLDGGTVQSITNLPSGLTTFDLGNNVARTAPGNCEFEIVDALPYIVPDVAMQGVLTATP